MHNKYPHCHIHNLLSVLFYHPCDACGSSGYLHHKHIHSIRRSRHIHASVDQGNLNPYDIFLYSRIPSSILQHPVQDICEGFHGVFYFLDGIGLGSGFDEDRSWAQVEVVTVSGEVDTSVKIRIILCRLVFHLE